MSPPRFSALCLPFLRELSALLLLTLVFSSLPPVSSAGTAKCNPADKAALLRFKAALGNPYYINTWTAATDCCTGWLAMECDAATGRVIAVTISVSDAAGPLPAALGDLPYLQTLDFRKSPNVTGPIPGRLARLARLKFLRLDWNGLTGSVPSFLGQMPTLEYVNLGYNKLSGSIPASLGGLPRLQSLVLDRNRLTGEIPAALGNLRAPNLRIDLSHNRLSGEIPASFDGLDIDRIGLDRNRLRGDPWPLFGAEKRAFLIDLNRNGFEFDLTRVVFPGNVGVIDLNHNRIYGEIPPAITKLWFLQLLNVSYNRLCGPVPNGGVFGWAGSRFDRYSFFHNRCLCGPPLENPCP